MGKIVNFNEFVIQFDSQPPRVIIELERRWCTCHCREIWVPKDEKWPYFCSKNQKLLGAGDANL